MKNSMGNIELPYPENSDYHKTEIALELQKEAKYSGYETRIQYKLFSNKKYAKVMISS